MKTLLAISLIALIAGILGISVDAAAQESILPSWIKSNAGWWSQGLISDDDFVKGIQYMVANGIIEISQDVETSEDKERKVDCIDAPFAGGWESYGPPYQGVKACKNSDGLVTVTGLAKNTGSGKTILTLPPEFRPSERLVFGVNANQDQNRVDVLDDGQIVHVAGNNQGWISLSGITYYTP